MYLYKYIYYIHYLKSQNLFAQRLEKIKLPIPNNKESYALGIWIYFLYIPCCDYMYVTEPGNFIMSMRAYLWFQKTNAYACMFYSWNPDRVPHEI